MDSLKSCKVKRRRRGKKRSSTGPSTGAAMAAAAAIASLPSKSGDDSSELDSEDIFSPCKQVSTRSASVRRASVRPASPDLLPPGLLPGSLRPMIVPRAPENSTQFLIDDHENSSLFLNFENSYKSPGWCYLPAAAPHMDVDLRDDSFDDEEHYCMRDFESEYQSAKEEVLLDWPRETLSAEILRLEARASSLEQMLILQDPDKYLSKLQEQLVSLQDENERLRASLRASTASSAASSTASSRRDASSGVSGSSDEDGVHDVDGRGLRHRARRRVDTASDLVMVVAPLSLRDSEVATSPTSGSHLLQMEIA